MAHFDGAIRQAVHALKYRDCRVIARDLGELMADWWKEHPMPADVVVPVPLHAERLRDRGYNQAALLARAFADQTDLPLDETTLIRHRSTATQTELDADQRRENVKDAFQCTSMALIDRRVLLIDDVCTTGATLASCAIALCDGGASEVRGLTLARSL